MNNSFLEKHRHGFVQQSVRNASAKFKVDPLFRFCGSARHVFTTLKLFPSEIPLNLYKSLLVLFLFHFLLKWNKTNLQ